MAINPPAIKPNPIAPLQMDLNGQTERNMNFIEDSVNYADGVSNTLARDIPADSQGFTLEPNALLRTSFDGTEVEARNDRPAFFDGGYHIRSYCNFTGFGQVNKVFNNNAATVREGYITLAPAANIQLPTFNATLPFRMRIVYRKSSTTSIPLLSFTNSGSYTSTRPSVTIDGAFEMDLGVSSPFKFTTNPGVLSSTNTSTNLNVLEISYRLATGTSQSGWGWQGGTSSTNAVLSNDDRFANSRIQTGNTLTYLGDNIINDQLTPRLWGMHLYYVDCLVGDERNRRTIT